VGEAGDIVSGTWECGRGGSETRGEIERGEVLLGGGNIAEDSDDFVAV